MYSCKMEDVMTIFILKLSISVYVLESFLSNIVNFYFLKPCNRPGLGEPGISRARDSSPMRDNAKAPVCQAPTQRQQSVSQRKVVKSTEDLGSKTKELHSAMPGSYSARSNKSLFTLFSEALTPNYSCLHAFLYSVASLWQVHLCHSELIATDPLSSCSNLKAVESCLGHFHPTLAVS